MSWITTPSRPLIAALIALVLAFPANVGAQTPGPAPGASPGPTPGATTPAKPTTSPSPTTPTPTPSESGSAADLEEPPPSTATPTPSVSGDEPAKPADTTGGTTSNEEPEQRKGDLEATGIFGSSPLCDERDNGMRLKAGGDAVRNCRWSGSIAQPHPTANYGLDQHVEADLTDPDSIAPSVLGAICQLIWAGLLYALRGVLLVVELAFSNDLVNGAMGSIKDGLAHVNAVFGTDSWQLAAISVLGLWGIWTGLVRRKTIQTVGGLAAAVGLMIVVQVIMIRPEATVGHVAKYANQGALLALSGTSTGTVDRPADSFGKASQQLFDTLVVRPWCALQFTSVEGCLKLQTAKDQPRMSIADVWLSYPANSPERNSLYKHLDGKPYEIKIQKKACRTTGATKWLVDLAADDSALARWNQFVTWGCSKIKGVESQRKIALKYDDDEAGVHTDASIQGKDGVFTRLALLGMIGFGLVGAIAVLLWIALRLLLAGIFALVLILFAPIVFLLAAFGDAGRRSVLAWGQKLLGLLVAKFLFALLLAIVVLVVGVINSLQMSWFSVWMLHVVLWWGLLLKREELLGFLALDRRTAESAGSLVGGGGGTSMSSLYYGWQMARQGIRSVTAPARLAIGAGRDHAARSAADALDHAAERDDRRSDAADASENLDLQHRTAETEAIREHDHGGLGEEARGVRDLTRGRDASHARETLRKRTRAEQRLGANHQRQREIDARLNGSGPPPTGQHRARLVAEQQELVRREAGLAKQVESWSTQPDRVAEARRASDALRRAKDAPGELSRREVDDYIAQRRQDIASLPAEHERNLIAGGINPDSYRRASAGEQARMRRRSAQAMDRSRQLIGSVTATGVLSSDELAREWQRVGGDPSGLRATVRSGEELGNVRRVDVEREAQRRREDARRNREAARERRARRHDDEVYDRARRRLR